MLILKFISKLFRSTRAWREHRLIFREIQFFQKIVFLALVFSVLAATFEGIGIGFLLSFLQSLTDSTAEPVRTGLDWFDIHILGVNQPAVQRLYRVSALVLLSTWLRTTFSYLSSVYIEISQLKLVDRVRKQIFEQLQSVNLSYFTTSHSGELINTITTETERLKQILGGISFIFTRSLVACAYFISMLLLSWQLSLVSILLFGLLALGLSLLNRRLREISFDITHSSSRLTSVMIEFINGIRTVHAFSTQAIERRRIYQASESWVQAHTKTFIRMYAARPISEVISISVLVSLLVIGYTALVLPGQLPVASLLTFFFVLFRLVPALQDINGVSSQVSTLKGSADSITRLLEPSDKLYFHNGTIELKKFEQAIELDSVNFGYADGNTILHDITLLIKKGQTTALVGASGAGKTTIADLIPRFHDPTAGKVLVDGIDLQAIEIQSWRKRIAIVSQDTFIFNTSLKNNIVYGSEGVSDDAIYEAARLANAIEFIEEMPEGFETRVGDRGVRLSGGQRQRIAIARALLRNPEILILDEATSALDSLSEKLIQESIEKLSAGRTVIAIAHRLSTISQADKVVVLEQGRIVEQGSYKDLLKHRGKLWEYHQVQYELGSV